MVIFGILIGLVVLAGAIVGVLIFLLKKEAGDDQRSTGIEGFNAFQSAKDKEPVQVPVGLSARSGPSAEEIAAIEDEYSKKVEGLQQELKDISQKAQAQSQEALTTIEKLKKENEELKTAKLIQNDPKLEADLLQAKETVSFMKQEQGVLQTRLLESDAQVRALREEAVAISHQITAFKEEAEKLTAQNKVLKESLISSSEQNLKGTHEASNALQEEKQDLKIRLADAQAEISRLKEENALAKEKAPQELAELKARMEQLVLENQGLKNAVDTALAEAKQLHEEIEAAKGQALPELAESKTKIDQLMLENQALKDSLEASSAKTKAFEEQVKALKQQGAQELQRSMEDAKAQAAKQIQEQIESVHQERQSLVNANTELYAVNQRLKEENEELLQKSDALQLELTRSRVQMASFERSCQNYEKQLQEIKAKQSNPSA